MSEGAGTGQPSGAGGRPGRQLVPYRRLRNLLHPGRFIGAVGWTLGLRFLGLPLQLLLFLLVARLHDVASVGLFAVVWAIWLGARSLGPLGFDFAAMRFIPAFAAEGREGAIRAYLRLGMVWSTGVSVLAAIVLIVIAHRWAGPVLLLPTADAAPAMTRPVVEGATFLLCALALPAYVLIGYLVGVLRARHRLIMAQSLEIVLLPLLGLALIALVAMADEGAGIIGTLAAMTAAAWAVAVLYLWQVRADLAQAPPLGHAERRSIIRTALEIGVSSAIVIVTLRLPVILLFLVAGAAASAYYEAAQRLAMLGTLGTWTIVAAVSPMMAQAHALENPQRLRRLVAGGIAVSAGLAACVLIGLLVLGPWLLGWFGAEYREAHAIAVVLALAFLVNALGGPPSTAYYMMGLERLALAFNLAGLAVLLVAVPLGALAAGPLGAALGFFLALLVRDGGMAFMARRILGLTLDDLDPRRLVTDLRARLRHGGRPG